jgi:hypothetical protein
MLNWLWSLLAGSVENSARSHNLGGLRALRHAVHESALQIRFSVGWVMLTGCGVFYLPLIKNNT